MSIKVSEKYPYLFEVREGFQHKDFLKALQGSTWDGEARCWLVPIDWGEQLWKRFGSWEVPNRGGSKATDAKGREEEIRAELSPHIRANRPYQILSHIKAVTSPGGFILAYEMKLGKSGPALDEARMRGFKKTLVISPAMSRPTWKREVAKWWPEIEAASSSSVFFLTKGVTQLGKKDTARWLDHMSNPFRLTCTSYGLAGKLPNELDFDCIIIDELHYISVAKSSQSRATRAIVERNLNAYRIGLTGTPQANDTASLYNPLDTLFPKRYGYFYSEKNPASSFAGRYTNVSFNGYGHNFDTIDPKSATEEEKARLQELRERLNLVMHRVTKKEVAHLLPPMQTESLRKDEDFSIKDLVENELAGGVTGIAIMCANKPTWDSVIAELASVHFPGLQVEKITGEEVSEKRDARLEQLKSAPVSVVVCSIAACALTLDLSRFYSVHFLEYTEKLAQMSQVMGRFQVPDGKTSINATLWYDNLSYETAQRLERKLEAQSAVMEAGNSEQQMLSAFSNQSRFSQEEWKNAIDDALSLIL